MKTAIEQKTDIARHALQDAIAKTYRLLWAIEDLHLPNHKNYELHAAIDNVENALRALNRAQLKRYSDEEFLTKKRNEK